MDSFWKRKKILVTGGAGFIGTHVVRNLVECRGVPRDSIIVPRSADCDLRSFDNAIRVAEGCDIFIHLAARTGSIAFSRQHPGSQYRDCMLMNLHVLEAARQVGAEKFLGIGNILVYPESSPSPLEEEYMHDGRVAATHLGVGTAKRDMVLLAEMYHREYGLDAVCVMSANTYGPHDRFDPEVSHVIPATIAKCHKQEDLVVWGDGSPTRDFLYVEDVAEGIVLAAEKMHAPNYVMNIASGTEISIKDLVTLIARLCEFHGDVLFDPTKSGGDIRRRASGCKARRLLGFRPRVTLEEGLLRTIEWYREAYLAKPELQQMRDGSPA
jgi:GDP-L-fucose synthase